MARQAGQNVDIRITATDAASPVLRGVGQTFQRMPEQFSKASRALQVFEGAAGQMGGSVAQAASKVSGLASLIATGGPIGIGIAAVTGAVALGTLAWKMHNQEAEQTKAMGAAVAEQLRKQTEQLDKQRSALDQLRERLKFYGQAAGDVAEAKADALERNLASAMERTNKIRERKLQLEKLTKGLDLANAEGSLKAEAEELTRLTELVSVDDQIAEQKRQKLAMLREEADMQKELAFIEAEADREKDETAAKDRTRRDSNRKHEQEKEQARQREIRAMLFMEEVLARQYAERKKSASLDAKFRQHVADTGDRIYRDSARKQHAIDQRQTEQFKNEQQERRRSIMSVASSVGGIFANAFEAMASGQKSASEAMRDATIQSAETAVNAYAAAGAAAAAAGNSAIPIVGWIGAGVAASIVFGLIKGYLGRIPKAAEGFLAQGGRSGIDSIPVMVQSGEGVLSVKQTAAVIRLADRVDRMERRGSSPSGGGSMALTINAGVLPSSADTARQVRKMMRMEARLRARGHR